MHCIHLRHPWQCEFVGEGVCWLRSFNWPTKLALGERARFKILGLPVGAVVALSGKPLVAGEVGVFDVTESLSPHNRLTIQLVDGTVTDETECPFDVQLEIVEA